MNLSRGRGKNVQAELLKGKKTFFLILPDKTTVFLHSCKTSLYGLMPNPTFSSMWIEGFCVVWDVSLCVLHNQVLCVTESQTTLIMFIKDRCIVIQCSVWNNGVCLENVLLGREKKVFRLCLVLTTLSKSSGTFFLYNTQKYLLGTHRNHFGIC